MYWRHWLNIGLFNDGDSISELRSVERDETRLLMVNPSVSQGILRIFLNSKIHHRSLHQRTIRSHPEPSQSTLQYKTPFP